MLIYKIHEEKGVARGSVSQHLPLHGVLLGCELQLSISGSLEVSFRGLEGVKVDSATAEGHILEVEIDYGGLGTCVISHLQEEEVCKFYHIGYRF